MPKGLSLSDVVNVTVNLSPLAAAYRNFGATLLLGDSDVIDTNERIRQYSEMVQVGEDFSSTSPEFLAAEIFFSQEPENSILYIGRWASTPTHGELHGAILPPVQQIMSNFTGISNGSMHVVINGTGHDITGLDFTGALNLNGVASVLQTGVAAAVSGSTVKWDLEQERFTITSPTTGVASTVGYATAVSPPAGTDVSGIFGFTNTVNTPAPIVGVLAESLVDCLQTLVDISSKWYAVLVAATNAPADADYLNAAAYIEAAGSAFNSRILGITTQETGTLDDTIQADLASELKAGGYNRTFIQYSSTNQYAAFSLWARQSTVNYEANNTTITLKFKQEPGVVAEYLTETWAQTLKDKNCNVFVEYQNDTAIIQEGVMSGGYYIDERVGADWFQNRIQTDVYNLLYQSPTKIPQTDAGTHQIVNTINKSCDAAVNNGWVAPGVWNVAGFGQLNQGDTLTLGYYVYAPLVATQAPADREQRKSVPIQVAAKLAGAIHSVNVAVTVNR